MIDVTHQVGDRKNTNRVHTIYGTQFQDRPNLNPSAYCPSTFQYMLISSTETSAAQAAQRDSIYQYVSSRPHQSKTSCVLVRHPAITLWFQQVTICYNILLYTTLFDTVTRHLFWKIPLLQACKLVPMCFFCYSSCIPLLAHEDVLFWQLSKNIKIFQKDLFHQDIGLCDFVWRLFISFCPSWISFKSQHQQNQTVSTRSFASACFGSSCHFMKTVCFVSKTSTSQQLTIQLKMSSLSSLSSLATSGPLLGFHGIALQR